MKKEKNETILVNLAEKKNFYRHDKSISERNGQCWYNSDMTKKL